MCDKNNSCEAVECGDGYCSWWKNGKCKHDHQLGLETNGSFHTCIKMFEDDYGIYKQKEGPHFRFKRNLTR